MKEIGAAKFKAHCLAILDEVQASGISVTVTKRGRPVAVLGPAESDTDTTQRAIGFLQSDAYRCDWDPETPAGEPEDWAALR